MFEQTYFGSRNTLLESPATSTVHGGNVAAMFMNRSESAFRPA